MKELLKSTKEQLQTKEKELQTNQEQVKKQLADQITQIKKATGLDTVMNKFISFESLLEKVKTKLEKGEKVMEARVEEIKAQFKEKEGKIKNLNETTKQQMREDLQSKDKELNNIQQEKSEIVELLKKDKEKHEKQLVKIFSLFCPKRAEGYTSVEFNSLYGLLEEINQMRPRIKK
ncbi:891_t:CDS:2 [Funneliformis geosporum]|nr:891_t:CDS:2 [Funneliformis geosporum]